MVCGFHDPKYMDLFNSKKTFLVIPSITSYRNLDPHPFCSTGAWPIQRSKSMRLTGATCLCSHIKQIITSYKVLSGLVIWHCGQTQSPVKWPSPCFKSRSRPYHQPLTPKTVLIAEVHFENFAYPLHSKRTFRSNGDFLTNKPQMGLFYAGTSSNDRFIFLLLRLLPARRACHASGQTAVSTHA